MRRYGFTLLEVILAVTMFSVILLATSNLELAATRLTNATGGEAALRRDLLYTLRVLERDLQSADEIVVTSAPDPNLVTSPEDNAHYEFALTFLDGSPSINYLIDLTPGSEIMTRTIQGVANDLLPDGVEPRLKYVTNAPQFPFSVVSGKIIMLHFAAESTIPGGVMALRSSASKSVLIRTAAVTLPPGGIP